MVGMFILAESLIAVCWPITVFKVLKKMQRSGSPKKENKIFLIFEKPVNQLTSNSFELNVSIGKDTTTPISRVTELSTLNRGLFNIMGVQGMTTKEQNDASLKSNVSCEVEGSSKMLCCLIQVKDKVAQSRSEHVWAHLVIQRSFLVTKMNSSLEQVTNGEHIGNIEVIWML